MLFRRLRQRWRERRFERKLQESDGVTQPRRQGIKEVYGHRIAILPLVKTHEQKEEIIRDPVPTRDVSLTQHPSRGVSMKRASQSGIEKSLDEVLLAFVKDYNRQQRCQCKDDVKILTALQLFVPSIKSHVETYVHKHHYAGRLRVFTERDLARWKRTQYRLNEDLRRMRDLVTSAARLHLVDRTSSTDAIHNDTQDIVPTKYSLVAAYLPYPEICFAMVVAAMLAGAYGLLLVGVILKLLHKI